MVPYAKKRFTAHIGRFTKLYDDITSKTVDEAWLAEVEKRDNIFLDMNCARYYLPRGIKPAGVRKSKKKK
jgi:1,4-alpha-glucan branching enzyme